LKIWEAVLRVGGMVDGMLSLATAFQQLLIVALTETLLKFSQNHHCSYCSSHAVSKPFISQMTQACKCSVTCYLLFWSLVDLSQALQPQLKSFLLLTKVTHRITEW